MPRIYPVILSGGSGTRLWPMSQPKMPKQFLPLTSEHSVLQETVLRLKALGIETPPTFVCNQLHQYLISMHLQEISCEAHAILIEPCARNTAPAIAVAALNLVATDPDAVMLILPSDHVIQNTQALSAAVAAGLQAVESGYLVTFGVVPTRPHTGYGYIQEGSALSNIDEVYQVASFKEKPDEETARQYLEQGCYSWNSGMFLLKAQQYLDELGAYEPEILAWCQQAVLKGQVEGPYFQVDISAFEQSPSKSMDYAVMERTTRAAVVKAEMGWNDIGTWGSLWEISPKDTAGNVTKGPVYIKDSQNCYVNSKKGFVALLGVEDLIVIETENAILIASKSHEQDVSLIAKQLEAQQS